MRLARRCGVNAAHVEFVRVGERQVLLAKRFDRYIDPAGRTFRNLYASAHTVLRLDKQTRGERQRSYVALAFEIQRWCGLADVDAAQLKRELWRRMAFNAICGNGDDHPRNHGLLFKDGRWTLSEAFDIAPYITFSGTLAMAITREGSSAARGNSLVVRHHQALAYRESGAVERTIGGSGARVAPGLDRGCSAPREARYSARRQATSTSRAARVPGFTGVIVVDVTVLLLPRQRVVLSYSTRSPVLQRTPTSASKPTLDSRLSTSRPTTR